jgi:hypothetical protein
MPFPLSGIGRYSGITFSDGVVRLDARLRGMTSGKKSDNQTYAFLPTNCSDGRFLEESLSSKFNPMKDGH